MSRTAGGFILGLLAAALLTVGLLVCPGLKKAVPGGRITVFLPFYSFPEKQEMEFLLGEFKALYPEVDLEYRLQPYLDMKRNLSSFLTAGVESADTAVVAALLSADQPEGALVSPGSWTGLEWNLYYSEEVLRRQGFSPDDLAALASRGLEEFIAGVKPRLNPDQPLFSVSTRYYIQYLSWLQHLELERTGGRMPYSFEPAQWEKAAEAFRDLVGQGLINADHGEINEAATALNMFRGEALFTLFTDGIYSIFLPVHRAGIRKLPFPGSSREGWFVGTGFYLTTFLAPKAPAPVRAAAEALVAFLRSDTAIVHMLENAGVRLNPVRGKRETREIPSLSERVRNEEINSLLDFLKAED